MSINEPRLNYVSCASAAGLHRMAYWEWGAADNDKILLCVHGLTRTGRDFDSLAQALKQEYRVICPDVVGRGKSDWLLDPNAYQVPQYVSDMVNLIAKLQPKTLDWVGTSMGGLIGLGLVGAMVNSKQMRANRGEFGLGEAAYLPLNKMVLNDVGPGLNMSGLNRIIDYVGQPKEFDDFEDAIEYVRTTSAGFGPHDAAGWADLTKYVFNHQGTKWVKHYDLRLAQPFALQTPEVMQAAEAILWHAWQNLPGKSLILRGADSDILRADTAEQMLATNAKASLVEFAGVGHAPTITSQDQIQAVCDFLLAD